MEKNNCIYKRILFLLLVLISFQASINAQNNIKILDGTVSYVNAKSIYVKFYSTKELHIGDTLYTYQNEKPIPSLVITRLSSISCVCELIGNAQFKIGDPVKGMIVPSPIPTIIKDTLQKSPIKQNITESDTSIKVTNTDKVKEIKKNKPLINGRLSVSMLGDFNQPFNSKSTRTRVSNSLNISNINGSKFSLESYLNYTHNYSKDQIGVGFFDEFKLYTLALGYQLSKNKQIWIGRRINPNISNMGAHDGIQYEQKLGVFSYGLLVGSKPNLYDFGYNLKLEQAGAFLAHNTNTKKGYIQTSIAFIEQRYSWKVDRRFTYFQHSSPITKNINFFISVELDLFKRIHEENISSVNFTSLYANVRYRITKKMSIQSSYDNRRNIIYYETYKTIIDKLIDQETRQGLRLQYSYNVFRYLSMNASAFFRFEGKNDIPTKNYLFNIYMNNIPKLHVTLSASTNYLKTDYIQGMIYSGRISKDVFKSKLNVELNYRKINYMYLSSETKTNEDVIGANLSFQLSRLSSVLIDIESTFANHDANYRYYITVLQRFKNSKKIKK